MLAKFTAWVKKFFSSPANQTGMVLGLATIAGMVNQYIDHNTALSGLVAGIVGTVVKIVQPDNSALASDVQMITVDAFEAWAERNPAKIAKIIADAQKITGDIYNPPPAAKT